MDGDKIQPWDPSVPTPLSAKGDTAVVRFLTPLAALAALWSFAAFHLDPSAAAEGRFLAILAGSVLLCAAATGRRSLDGLATGAVLTVAAAWLLPFGPLRGSAVVVLAGGTLAWALARRWSTATDSAPTVWPLQRASWTVPAAVGIQVLFRAELLLPDSFGPRALLTLVVVPATGAVAAVLASRRHRPETVLTAVAAALVAAQGWTLLLSLGLLALVAGEEVRQRRPLPMVFLVGLAGAALAAGWEPREALLVLALLAGAAWSPAAPAAPAPPAAQPRHWRERPMPVAPLLLPLLTLLVLGSLELWPALVGRSWAASLTGLALLPLLLPRLLLTAPVRALLLGLVAVAALRAVPGDGTLAPILAAGALGLPATGIGARLERGWLGLVLVLTTALATYPWLREPAAASAFELLGLGGGWSAAALVLALGAVLGASFSKAIAIPTAKRPSPELALTAGALVVALLAASHVPAGGPDLLPSADQLLDARHPNWGIDLEPRSASALVVDSALAFGATLAPGTPVATLRCFHPDGSRSEWILEAGHDTAEWAARRSDVRAASGPAPPPFSTAVAPDGRFLGQRYRAVFALDTGKTVRRVSVLRRPDLPADVELSLLRVELRP